MYLNRNHPEELVFFDKINVLIKIIIVNINIIISKGTEIILRRKASSLLLKVFIIKGKIKIAKAVDSFL